IAGHSTTPVICVAPVRSHCIPIITSFCCAAAVPASAAVTAPATSASMPLDRLIVASPFLFALGSSIFGSAAHSGRYRQARPAVRRLSRFLDGGGNDLRVGADPVGLLDELATLGLEDLHPASALIIFGGDLPRWHQPVEGEIVDRLEPLLDLLAGRFLAAIRLDPVSNRLDMRLDVKQPSVVINLVSHSLVRFFARFLVHTI